MIDPADGKRLMLLIGDIARKIEALHEISGVRVESLSIERPEPTYVDPLVGSDLSNVDISGGADSWNIDIKFQMDGDFVTEHQNRFEASLKHFRPEDVGL